MLLNQQDQRCAAHTAQLTVEGWFNPPSTQSANAAASAAAQGNTLATSQTTTPDAAENQQQVDSIFSVVPSELQAIQQLTSRGCTLDAAVFLLASLVLLLLSVAQTRSHSSPRTLQVSIFGFVFLLLI
jgi:hypothetical protein